jgi:hypothetical protein
MNKIKTPAFKTQEELTVFLKQFPRDWGVHVTHCCSSGCVYCDDDCPVATGKITPSYACEDCDCLEMTPGADVDADNWWNSLSGEQKVKIYLRNSNS